MGKKKIKDILSEEMLDDYVLLTYLTRAEILHVLNRFHSIAPDEISQNLNYRVHRSVIMEKFPVLKFNPFSDRIFQTFSSLKDDNFSFEDMLDLCSVMSQNCPQKVKAIWAFKVFDLDDDNIISVSDLCRIMDRLTFDRIEHKKVLSYDNKLKISRILIDEMHLHHDDGLGPTEFHHLIAKIPEFKNSFYFTI